MKIELNCIITKTKNNGKFVLVHRKDDFDSPDYYDFYSAYDLAQFVEVFFSEPVVGEQDLPTPPPYTPPTTTADEIF